MNAPSDTMAATRFPRGLYGITPEWNDASRLSRAVEAAAEGGMVALQWRRKTLPARDAIAQAAALAKLCKELRVLFIVNDSWKLAAAVDADGAHLGRDDGSLAQARSALGKDKLIGCSCYDDLQRARLAMQGGADYIAFGSMYPSSIKPDAVRAGLDQIREARELTQREVQAHGGARVAVVAIGGITPQNAAPIVQAGADAIALITGLFETADIRASAAACQALF